MLSLMIKPVLEESSPIKANIKSQKFCEKQIWKIIEVYPYILNEIQYSRPLVA